MKQLKYIVVWALAMQVWTGAFAQSDIKKVPEAKMKEIYEEVKTPYKYGMVVVPDDNSKKVDCPTVFRKGNNWFMTYIVFDGRGYETWIAKSSDLLHWKTQGRILSFITKGLATRPCKTPNGAVVTNYKNMMASIGYLILADMIAVTRKGCYRSV